MIHALAGGEGAGRRQEVRTFGTTTRELLKPRDRLTEEKVAEVVEATGQYWRGAFSLLEEAMDVLPVNPAHVKGLRLRTAYDVAAVSPGLKACIEDLGANRLINVADGSREYSRPSINPGGGSLPRPGFGALLRLGATCCLRRVRRRPGRNLRSSPEGGALAGSGALRCCDER